MFPAGADDEVYVCGEVEVFFEHVFGNLVGLECSFFHVFSYFFCCVDDFGSSAVAECEVDSVRFIVFRAFHKFLYCVLNAFGEEVGAADKVDFNIFDIWVFLETGECFLEELHEVIDFFFAAVEVFHGECVEGDFWNVQLFTPGEEVFRVFVSLLMAEKLWHAALFRVATIPVQDNCEVARGYRI